MQVLALIFTGFASALLVTGCAAPTPTTLSNEGLPPIGAGEFNAVYARPGVDFGQYDNFTITGCEVGFKKNWQREQNGWVRNPSRRVRQEDMQAMRQALSSLCLHEFEAALCTESRQTLICTKQTTAATLVVVPSLIDVDISAPDIQGASRSQTMTSNEGGEMTLFLKVLDGATGETLYRVRDRKRTNQSSLLQWANRVTNAADAKRIMRQWGAKLRDVLGQVSSGESSANQEEELTCCN